MNNNPPPADLKRTRRIRKTHSTPNTDRLPPYSPEAEQGVLGCIMLDPVKCLPECMAAFRMGIDVFYDLRHQTIYNALMEMSDDASKIDTITLQQKLKDKQLLEQIGGLAYLSSLSDTVPSAANLSYYLGIVQEKYLLRKMIHTCTDTIGRVYEFEEEASILLDEFERDALAIRLDNGGGEINKTAVITECIDDLNRAVLDPKRPLGIPSGFADFDRMTRGFREQQLIVIAARPSVGKTSFAMCVANHISISNKISVGVFSLEMSGKELIEKLGFTRSKVDQNKVYQNTAGTAQLTQDEIARVSKALGEIQSAPLHIDDEGGLTIVQIQAKARRMVQRQKIKLLIVDYLQLIRGTNNRQSRYEQVTEVSEGIKAMAKELKIPVLVLAQLNRECESEKRSPRLSDLRDSGSIEQDADVVGLLHRKTSESGVNSANGSGIIEVELNLAKVRNGQTGPVNLVFFPSFTRFESARIVSESQLHQPKEQPTRNGHHNQHPACPTEG